MTDGRWGDAEPLEPPGGHILVAEPDRSAQILEALDDGVLLIDGAGRLLLANPAARLWFGLEGDSHIGLVVHRALGVPAIGELATEAATTGRAASGVVTLIFPQHRTIAVRALPLVEREPSGGTVVTLTDITERGRLEALRRDFVANASHELKTPVAALRALAETLATALPEDPVAASRFVVRIQREADRLDRLVQDLLDLSRMERGDLALETVDLEVVAKEVVALHAERAEGGKVRLRLQVQPAATVRGDRAQLTLLLSNLVDNAVRYTRAGGSVLVDLRRSEDSMRIEVADTGRGIPQEELPRIFERFYRVDKARARRTGGTGLGLAIVRHVAESHGGTVTAASELGRGTTLTVMLPVAGLGERTARG